MIPSPSKSSDLDPALLAAAGEGAGAAPAAPAAAASPTPAAGGINWKQEAREVWQCVALLGMRFPSVEAVYHKEQLDRLAEVWAPIFERHNWTFAKWAIYIAAASATAPVIGETVKAIRADRAAEAEAAAPKPAAAVV